MENKYKRKSDFGDPQYDVVYTKHAAIKEIIDWATEHKFFDDVNIFLDSTAGDGRLSEYLPTGIVYYPSDIQPQSDFVERKDYLDISRPDGGHVCAGFNPPFGICGNKAKAYITFLIEHVQPDSMLLILPFIRGGWLPDGYRVRGFLDRCNIFAHGSTGKSVTINVRVYFFVRDPEYKHVYDLRSRYSFKTLTQTSSIHLAALDNRSKKIEEEVKKFNLPVLWVKRTGERSGRVLMIDNDGTDENWDFLEPGKEWKSVTLKEVDKDMRMTHNWVQICGIEVEWMKRFGYFCLKHVEDDDIFKSGSSLSPKAKNGGITIDCVRHYLSKFLDIHPAAKNKNTPPGKQYYVRK